MTHELTIESETPSISHTGISRLAITAEIAKSVNYAMQQNDMPVINRVLKNH